MSIKTLIGKEGFLFLQNDSARELEVHNNNLCIVNNYFSNAYTNIKNKYLMIIFPNKSLLYKEYLPDEYNLQYRPGYIKYKEYLENHILDGYEILKKEKEDIINEKNDLLYYKTDTHINLYGNIVIYKNFIKKIKELFDIDCETIDYQINKKEEILINLRYGLGDLTWEINAGNESLMNMNDIYYYSDNIQMIYMSYIINSDDYIKLYKYEDCTLIDKTLELDNNILVWEILSKYILYRKNENKIKKKVLIFYDSFLINMLKVYLELFDEVYMAKSILNLDLINSINPDYIFEFRVERFLL